MVAPLLLALPPSSAPTTDAPVLTAVEIQELPFHKKDEDVPTPTVTLLMVKEAVPTLETYIILPAAVLVGLGRDRVRLAVV